MLDILNAVFYVLVMLSIALVFLISGTNILRYLRSITMVNVDTLKRVRIIISIVEFYYCITNDVPLLIFYISNIYLCIFLYR